MLVLCMLWGLSDSIWTGTIVVAWVQLLAGGPDAHDSNRKVGYVEATQGMAMLLTALPVGYIADKYSRQLVIRAGGIGFILATIMTLTAIIHSRGKKIHNILQFSVPWHFGALAKEYSMVHHKHYSLIQSPRESVLNGTLV